MQSNAVRAGIALGTIAVVIVLFVVLSGGDDESSTPVSPQVPATETTPDESSGTEQTTTTTTTTVEVPVIRVRGGKPVGGVAELEYTAGERVRFTVRSDVSDEVHVHGYDISRDVEAGGSVPFNFEAKLEGVFEIELEGRKVQIGELRVNPS